MLPPAPRADKIPSKILIADQLDPFEQKRPQMAHNQVAKPIAKQPEPKQLVVSPKTKPQSKELAIILERQRLFREAALKAKQGMHTI